MSGQLVLKSQNAVTDISALPDIQYYINRVLSDGGEIVNEAELLEAFAFIYTSGLTSDHVVSATNPSWGIKKTSDGIVEKLYNLFDPVGDILFATSGTIKPRYNTTKNFPSVYFGGGTECRGKLAGLFDVTKSIATVTVNAIPFNVTYGTQLIMPVTLVWSEKNFKDDGVTSPSDYITIGRTIMRPNITNTNPSEWWNSVAVGGLAIGSTNTAINEQAKPIAAYYNPATGLDILGPMGSVAHSGPANINTRRLTNLTFNLGVSINGEGSAFAGNIVSHFFENWILRDVSIENTLLFTQRVNTKYYNKI